MTIRRTGQVAAGILLMTLGAFIFGLQVGLLEGVPWRQYWPVLLIAFGLAYAVSGPKVAGAGLVWAGSGGILLMHTLGVLSLRVSWPLFIVVNGFFILFQGWRWTSGTGRKGNGHVD